MPGTQGLSKIATGAVAFLVLVLSITGYCYVDYLHGYRKYIGNFTTPTASPFVGILLVFLLQVWPHVYRCRALIPMAALMLVVAWTLFVPSQLRGGAAFECLHSLAAGLSLSVLLRTLLPYSTLVRLIVALPVTFLALVAWFFIVQCWDPKLPYDPPPLLLPAMILFGLSVGICVRPLAEVGFEIPTRICYRMRAHGPGIAAFPTRGPVILIANHASYTDPLFLAADVPRPLTPMMTSKFYDRWLIYPLVKFVFGVIRVPEVSVKRSTPELDLAVRALNEGKCLVIFPEGYLQRKEDQPLRRFGRGVWEILKARPETPVVAAWIEGGWGSFFSYWNGPPTKKKRPDFRRPISIGYTEPFTVPTPLLEDHWATRYYLMNRVGSARALTGLPRIPEMELPEKGSGDDPESFKGDQKAS